MKHFTTTLFWAAFKDLPTSIQELAKKNFEYLKENPRHPSVTLKKVGKYYSARVGLRYRTIGVEVPGGILWFWIGTHADYDRIVE